MNHRVGQGRPQGLGRGPVAGEHELLHGGQEGLRLAVDADGLDAQVLRAAYVLQVEVADVEGLVRPGACQGQGLLEDPTVGLSDPFAGRDDHVVEEAGQPQLLANLGHVRVGVGDDRQGVARFPQALQDLGHVRVNPPTMGVVEDPVELLEALPHPVSSQAGASEDPFTDRLDRLPELFVGVGIGAILLEGPAGQLRPGLFHGPPGLFGG